MSGFDQISLTCLLLFSLFYKSGTGFTQDVLSPHQAELHFKALGYNIPAERQVKATCRLPNFSSNPGQVPQKWAWNTAAETWKCRWCSLSLGIKDETKSILASKKQSWSWTDLWRGQVLHLHPLTFPLIAFFLSFLTMEPVDETLLWTIVTFFIQKHWY